MKKRKLKSVEFYNFQGQRNTKIELHENLNAVVGPSGVGKSSILKGLSWIYDDTVQGEKQYGDSIYSHAIKGKTKKGNETFLDIMFVKVTFTDGYSIKKIAGNKPTHYEIGHPDGSMKPLTANGRGAPDQVAEIFNFKDFNYSDQWNPYYLLFQTGGKIAEKLDEYTDMTLPRKILKKINSDTKSASATLKVIVTQIEEKKDELKDYEKVEIMKKALDNLQDLVYTLEEVKVEVNYLIESKVNLETFEDQLKAYKHIDLLDKTLKGLSIVGNSLSLLSEDILQIESCLDDWEYLEKALLQFTTLDTLESSLNELKIMRRNLDAMDNSLESMLFDKDSLISLVNILKKYDTIDELEKNLLVVNKLNESILPVNTLLRDMEKDQDLLTNFNEQLKDLPPVELLLKLEDLSKDVCTLDELDKMITGMNKDMGSARELSVSLKQLDVTIKELDKELEGQTCPLCGKGQGECSD